MGNKELNENELDNVVGGGSTIVDGSSIPGLETIGSYPYFSSGNLMSLLAIFA